LTLGGALRSDAGRWLSIALRSLHLAGAAWLAAALLGAPVSARCGAALMLASGLLLFGADLVARRIAAHELAGAWVLIKLVLVSWMALDPARAPWIFFVVLLLSSVASHAPRALRHWAPGRAGSVGGKPSR
jgi:hypothetical protein